MKKPYKYIFLFLLSLFFASCEDVIQVDLDEGSKLYVVDAFINDLREPQVIKVNYSDAYFSNREPEPVTGAKVVVKDLTAGKDYAFTDEGGGNHVLRLASGDTMCRIGHQYRLEVTVGGVVYEALTTQKRTAAITNIDTNYVPAGSNFGQTFDAFYYCELQAMDPVAGETDYYWVKNFRNDSLFFEATDMGFSFSIDGTNGPVSGVDADSTNFTPPATFVGFKQFLPGDKCKVEIHSLTREAYNFFIQLAQQVNNGGLFATTPENVRTNLVTPKGSTKAVGWFNVATVAKKEILIP